MEHISATIARLNPFDKPLKIGERVINGLSECQEFVSSPTIQSMFLFIANARNHLMFDKSLFDLEVISGRELSVNWINRFQPAPSDYAPVLLDVWEFDIGRAAQHTQTHIDITAPVSQWVDFARQQQGLLHPQGLAAALYDIELDVSHLRELSVDSGRLAEAVFDLISVREQAETGLIKERDDTQNSLTRGN